MLPIRGLALGALMGNVSLLRQGAISVAVGTGLAIIISCIISLYVALPSYGSEVLARSKPTRQVQLLEEFISRDMKQSFKLIL